MKFNLEHINDPSDIILVYKGKFDPPSAKSVLLLAERNIESIAEDPSVKRKVFNILVECLQNVVKHGELLEQQERDETLPVLLIGRENDHYIVASGNAMFNEGVDDLKAKIEKINHLDKTGLKQLYKRIMKNNAISAKGGAGLGLVDMARKSGQNLIYDFTVLDDKVSYFSLKTIVPRP